MDKVGAEVGQKMRSAIKAKLLELNCYVDDELPDYIMVMVANRRNKMQMKEDLNLFLNTKTEAFVDWLHIVLKKLKEVTVTNPDVYKFETKRKSSDQEDIKVKREKKFEKPIHSIKKEDSSMPDNLPKIEKQLSESRQDRLLAENRPEDKTNNELDLPIRSEVNASNKKDILNRSIQKGGLEKQNRSLKSRIGMLVDKTDIKEMNVKLPKNECEQIRSINLESSSRIHIQQTDNHISQSVSVTPEKQRRHSPITFERDGTPPKKTSVLKRLGDRVSDRKIHISNYSNRQHRSTKHLSSDMYDRKNSRNERRHSRSGDRNRLGDSVSPKIISGYTKNALSQVEVMSKIHVPEKVPEELHDGELKIREVRSMVKVKPRVIYPGSRQPNKNLLLKAVEEAHRSVSETTNIKVRRKNWTLKKAS